MISGPILRNLLKVIYGVADKYLVPLNESEWVPTAVHDDVGTWIGYRILDLTPLTRAYVQDKYVAIPIRANFRVTFVGKEAELFASHTLLWDVRSDVIKVLEDQAIQLNYQARKIYSKPVYEEGQNDKPCWIVDMACQTTYVEDTGWRLWHLDERSKTWTKSIT